MAYKCQTPECDESIVISVTGKVKDLFDVLVADSSTNEFYEYDGYVINGLEIGSGDYITFAYCPKCGRINGDFPLEIPYEKLKKVEV